MRTVGDDPVPATEVSPAIESPPTETARGGSSLPMGQRRTTPWAPGAVVEGRFEVRDVRRGGMGEVYFVFDRALALNLAVKTPLPKTLATASGRLRFLREAEAWIGLGLHVNICTAYYVRELDGIARLFIEFIDGDGLDVWMKSKNAQSLTRRLDMAIQVASGVHHAHTFEWLDEGGAHHQGLAHRDLKPANVLVGSDGVAKVTDFGLVGRGLVSQGDTSETLEDFETAMAPIDGIWKTVTLSGGLMGTPPYMPPEQWDGGHGAGKPADIYAFGCILFELFCGRRPFVLSESDRRAVSEVQLATMEELHRKAQPPPPQTLSVGIDGDLADLMLQCLSKDPALRPSSFAEIRARLVEIFGRVTERAYPRRNPKARRLLGDALNNQGVSYATLGQKSRAERAWKEALANDPRHIEATFNLAIFRWQYQGWGDAETLAQMEEVLRGEAPPWKARHLAGKLSLAVGESSKALEYLASAHRDSGGMPDVARDYAVALCGLKDAESQVADFNEVVQVLSSCGGPLRFDPLLLTTYALAMRNLGKSSRATSLYAEARRNDPDLPDDLERGVRSLIPGSAFVSCLQGFPGRALQLAFDVEGRRAASVLQDGAVCIWNPRSGEIERMIRASTDRRPRCIALSLDGTQLVSSTEGDPVAIWHTETAISLHRFQPHSGFLNALKVSPDGRRAIGVGTTGNLNVWDLGNHSLEGVFHLHSGFLTDVALAADCRTAITGGSGARLLVVDVYDGEIITRLQNHQSGISAVAISGGGRVAVSGDESGELCVWDLPEGDLRHTLRGHRGEIRSVSIDQTVSTCLSTDRAGSIRLWDLETGRLLTSLTVDGDLHCCSATPDWTAVLVGHGPSGLSLFDFSTTPRSLLMWAVASPVTVGEADRRAKRFNGLLEEARKLLAYEDSAGAIEKINLARGIPGYSRINEALELAAEAGSAFPRGGLKAGWADGVFRLHQARVNCITTGHSNDTVVSVGGDRQVLLWQLTDGTILRSFEPIETPELAAAFLPEGRQFVTAGLDNRIRLWEIDQGDCIRTFEGHMAQVNVLATSGSLILSGSSDQTARVWDAETGVCLQVFDGHSGEIIAVSMSPGTRLCASSAEDQLLLWDPLTGRDVFALTGHDTAPSAIIWSDDGRNLLTGAADGQLRLWDVGNGRCLRTMEVEGGVAALALSPDDRFALVGSRQGTVQLWDVRSRHCLRTFDGHVGAVPSVAFSIDGQRCLSAGEDGTIRLWYLDWNTAPGEETGWNEQARSYLEVFLAQQSRTSGRPRWGDQDFRRLLDDLERRRLGRLSPQEVLHNLENMAADWNERDISTTTMTRTIRTRRPVSTTRQQKAKKKLLRRSAAAGAFVCLLVILATVISSTRLGLNPDRCAAVKRSAIEARVPYGMPLSPNNSCIQSRFRQYLEICVEGAANPVDINEAARCLVQLEDSRAVAPLLNLLGSPDPPSGIKGSAKPFRLPIFSDEILSILIPLADKGSRELQEALVDADEPVRLTAAKALAAAGSKRSISALVDSAGDREPVVRIAVSRNLEAIAAAPSMKTDVAFKLFESLAHDPYPEIRINVARSLGVFRGSKPHRLLKELAQDPDRDVSVAAARALIDFDQKR